MEATLFSKPNREQPENAQPLLDRQGSADVEAAEVLSHPQEGETTSAAADAAESTATPQASPPQRTRRSSYTFPFSVGNLRLSPVAQSAVVVPELPDAVSFWEQQRGLMFAFSFMSGITIWISLLGYGRLAGIIGLIAGGLYFFQAGPLSDKNDRAKVVYILCSICALIAIVLSFVCALLLFAVAASPTWEAKEDPNHAGLAEVIVLILCHLIWYGLLGGLAVTAARRFNFMLCLANPVSSGLAEL